MNFNPQSGHDSLPVDMEQLRDMVGTDPQILREVVNLYLNQTSEQINQLKSAIETGAGREVERLAHSCAGSSATCGAILLVSLLRQLEQMGRNGQLEGADEAVAEVARRFDRVQDFFKAALS